ncbi:MAG: iron ABC transporter permease [Phycisphaerales bacterium]|nr:iron ABC transporter permease [Phycisphaerales bacterium]
MLLLRPVRTRRIDLLVFAALLGFLTCFLLVPIWYSVRGALHDSGGWTLFHVVDVFRDSQLRQGLWNALLIGACSTIVASAVAIPMAVVSARFSFKGKGLLNGFLLAPLILPPFVGAIGLEAIIGRTGTLNVLFANLGLIAEPIDFLLDGGFICIVALTGLHLYPILYLNLVAALANIDPGLEEAARNVGAGPWSRFLHITLPMLRGGFFAGATIVFVWSFTELGTPLMFGFRTVTSVQIFDGLKEIETSREPYALTVVMFVVATGIYLLGRSTLGRTRGTTSTKASVRRTETPLGWKGTVGAWALLGGISLIACAPHLGVVLSAFSAPGSWYLSILPQAWTTANFENALQHPLAAGAIRNSLFLAGCAVVLDLVLGVAAARILIRTKLPGRWLLDLLVMLPIAVPGLVMAFGFVSMSLEWPFASVAPSWLGWLQSILPAGWWEWFSHAPLASWGNIVGAQPNPFPFLIIAYAVRRLPYVVRATAAGLEQTPVDLEEAAASVGAKPNLILRKIVVPLVAANLIAGALLAFSLSMLEVSDSLLLAQREGDFPVTKAIYTLFDRLGDGPAIASAMGTWAMLLLAATLLAASSVLGKRLGAVFRG